MAALAAVALLVLAALTLRLKPEVLALVVKDSLAGQAHRLPHFMVVVVEAGLVRLVLTGQARQAVRVAMVLPHQSLVLQFITEAVVAGRFTIMTALLVVLAVVVLLAISQQTQEQTGQQIGAVVAVLL
jgi:hypothetical protein